MSIDFLIEKSDMQVTTTDNAIADTSIFEDQFKMLIITKVLALILITAITLLFGLLPLLW